MKHMGRSGSRLSGRSRTTASSTMAEHAPTAESPSWATIELVHFLSLFPTITRSTPANITPASVLDSPAWVLFLKCRRSTIRTSVIELAVWLPLTFSPINVLLIPKRGRPRLIPLLMGLPTRETAERAQRGEVILGGCIVSGFEPKYYLVW